MTAVSDEVRPAADMEIPPVAAVVRPAAGAEVPPVAGAVPPAAGPVARATGVVAPAADRVELVDLLDRLTDDGGSALGDELVISVAGVDLVRVPLHALVATVRNGMAGIEDLEGTAQGPSEGPSERTSEGMERTWPEMG